MITYDITVKAPHRTTAELLLLWSRRAFLVSAVLRTFLTYAIG